MVLPTPPLEPATRIVFIRGCLPIGLPAGYTACRGGGRKRAGRLAIVARIPPDRRMSQLQYLTALIRANTPLVVVETRDEDRVVELFRQSLLHVWRVRTD